MTMSTIVNRFIAQAPRILGAMRILFGVLFALHGAQKVFGVFGGMPPNAPKLIVWTAGPIELIAGILIAIGLFTRISAFLASGQMAIAYFVGHAPNGFWPVLNGGGRAIYYCFTFLFLSAAGGGRWSLDSRIQRNHSGSVI